MADHAKPTLGSTYANFVAEINGRLQDLARGLDPAKAPATGLPTDAVAWNSAAGRWDRWTGAAWTPLATVYAITAQAAQRLAAGVTVGLTGDVSGTSAAWDGSGNVSVNSTLATVLASPGTVGSATEIPVLTFDAKGRCTGISRQAMSFWHAGNFNPASKADLSGGSVFSGPSSFNGFHIGSTDSANWSWFSMGGANMYATNAVHIAVNGSASDGLGANALHIRTMKGATGTAFGVEADGTTRALKAFAAMGTASFAGGSATVNTGNPARVGLFDRANGSFVVQLGGADNARSFEVIDRDWTTSIFAVAMNNLSYKGQAIWWAGNFNPAAGISTRFTTVGNTSTTDLVETAVPWYGIGGYTRDLLGVGGNQIGLSGFYGVRIRSNWLTFDVGQSVASSGTITAPQLAVTQAGGNTLTRLQIDSPAGQTGLLASFSVGASARATIDANGWITASGISADRLCAGFDSAVSGSVNAAAWFRSCGQTGWYNSTYNVGIWATDAGMVRVYGPAGVGLAAPGRIFGNAGIQGQSPAGNGLGAITVSSADPSGGAQGDIWFKV